MAEMTINGRTVPIQGNESVLEVAQREGIWIPTLCHHPALPPYGACRLCLVEVKAGGRPGLAASCVLPAADGLVVETDSERVKKTRRILVKLLLEMTDKAPAVLDLASKLGVEALPQDKGRARPENRAEDCVLCGLCVRACESVGAFAISFAYRGSKRAVMPPFGAKAEECIGCQACAQVCPTGVVDFRVEGDRLVGEPWGAEIALKRCVSCQALFIPAAQADYLKRKFSLEFVTEDLCPECRRRHTVPAP